jgi:hypothetical protein
VITAAPLVCEGLASLDEVADSVRRLGPSLVVTADGRRHPDVPRLTLAGARQLRTPARAPS